MMPYTAARPRIDLAAAIPLPAPFVLWCEPTNVCNFRCTFCPESLAGFEQQSGHYSHMTPALWSKVLCSLKQWPRLKVIRFYLLGEPLLNTYLARMIADSHDVAERTVVTTNGSLLTKRAHELVNADLAYLKVSIYGTGVADYHQHTGSQFFSADAIWVQMAHFMEARARRARPYVYAELVTPGVSPEEAVAFRLKFAQVSDEVGVLDELHNWGGEDPRLVQLGTQDERLACPVPFYQIAVRANGAVTVCCVDWNNRLQVGDANTQSLQEIWEGDAMRGIRAVHLAGGREHLKPCRNCSAMRKHPDNIDRLVYTGITA